jgi:hypothetical protein
MIEYRQWVRRADLRAEPETLFVFGDNMQFYGMKGQAKEMRGEPNAVGIPTKRRPSMEEDAFLSDEDLPIWNTKSERSIVRLLRHHGKIVWPKDGIGTGLAQLPKRAPLIWDRIETLRTILERT